MQRNLLSHNEIIEICRLAYDKCNLLIPFTANIVDTNWERSSNNWMTNLYLHYLFIRRKIERHDKKKLQPLALQENNHPYFLAQKVNDVVFNIKHPTLQQVMNKCKSLPNKQPKTIHKNNRLIGENYTQQERVENQVKHAAFYHSSGACAEFAIVTYFLLQSYCYKNMPKEWVGPDLKNNLIRIEKILLEDKDHTCIVVNRAIGSDINNISKWGKAIIIDPWAKEIFDVATKKSIISESGEPWIYDYIKESENIIIDNESYIGEGWSTHYEEKCELKRKQVNPFAWQTAYLEKVKHQSNLIYFPLMENDEIAAIKKIIASKNDDSLGRALCDFVNSAYKNNQLKDQLYSLLLSATEHEQNVILNQLKKIDNNFFKILFDYNDDWDHASLVPFMKHNETFNQGLSTLFMKKEFFERSLILNNGFSSNNNLGCFYFNLKHLSSNQQIIILTHYKNEIRTHIKSPASIKYLLDQIDVVNHCFFLTKIVGKNQLIKEIFPLHKFYSKQENVIDFDFASIPDFKKLELLCYFKDEIMNSISNYSEMKNMADHLSAKILFGFLNEVINSDVSSAKKMLSLTIADVMELFSTKINAAQRERNIVLLSYFINICEIKMPRFEISENNFIDQITLFGRILSTQNLAKIDSSLRHYYTDARNKILNVIKERTAHNLQFANAYLDILSPKQANKEFGEILSLVSCELTFDFIKQNKKLALAYLRKKNNALNFIYSFLTFDDMYKAVNFINDTLKIKNQKGKKRISLNDVCELTKDLLNECKTRKSRYQLIQNIILSDHVSDELKVKIKNTFSAYVSQEVDTFAIKSFMKNIETQIQNYKMDISVSRQKFFRNNEDKLIKMIIKLNRIYGSIFIDYLEKNQHSKLEKLILNQYFYQSSSDKQYAA